MHGAKRGKARVAVSDRRMGGCEGGKGGGSTSPSKVYAKRERTADFLLGEGSVERMPRSRIGLELFGRLEDDPVIPRRRAAPHTRQYRQYNGFLGPDLAGLEGFTVDERIGLAGADAVGIDADGKEAEEGETGLFIGHVDRVGIRK